MTKSLYPELQRFGRFCLAANVNSECVVAGHDKVRCNPRQTLTALLLGLGQTFHFAC